MYGHANLLLETCSCGRSHVTVVEDGGRLCTLCYTERENSVLPASQPVTGRVPAST